MIRSSVDFPHPDGPTIVTISRSRTFNDTSSSRFLDSGSFKQLLGAPIIDGPKEIHLSREERPDGIILRASHDGYAGRFVVVHQRALKLSVAGNRIDGEDLFVAANDDMIQIGGGHLSEVHTHLGIVAR